MKKAKSSQSKQVIFNALLIALTSECSFDVYQEEIAEDNESGIFKVAKYDLQFVHRIEGCTRLNSCIYDHCPIEYRDVEGSNNSQAYYTVGLSVL